jgi:hypothetical protein
VPADHPQQFQRSRPASLDLRVAEVVVDVEIHLLFKEPHLRRSDPDIRQNQVAEEVQNVPLEEGSHVRPHHETLEKLQAVEDDVIEFLVLGRARAQLPDFLTKVLDGLLDVFLVLAGIKQDGLEGCSLALEDLLARVLQAHDLLEHPHPVAEVVLELGMQVLIVEIVEDLEHHFHDDHLPSIAGVLHHPLQRVHRQL